MSLPEKLKGLSRLRTKTTVSRTTLYLMLLATHGFERLIDRRVDLVLRHPFLTHLLSRRRKILVELLEHWGTFATLGDPHGFKVQFSLRKGDLQHTLLSNPKLFAKLGRNGDLTAPKGPDNP